MISLKPVSNSKARKWTLLGLAALAAIRLYQVQEMIAALAIFSVLFALVAGAALTLFLLDRAGQRTLAWAAPRTTHVAQIARRVLFGFRPGLFKLPDVAKEIFDNQLLGVREMLAEMREGRRRK